MMQWISILLASLAIFFAFSGLTNFWVGMTKQGAGDKTMCAIWFLRSVALFSHAIFFLLCYFALR